MKILLVQNMIYVPALGGANKSNRRLLEGLVEKNHTCKILVPAIAKHGPQTRAQFLDELSIRGINLTASYPGVDVFQNNGVEVHAVSDIAKMPAYLLSLLSEYQPDWTLVSSEDPGQVLLESALEGSPGRVIYMARTTWNLPFGPACFLPNSTQTELMRQTAGIIVISDYLKDYIQQWGGMKSVVIRLSLLNMGAGPYPDFSCFDRGYVTMINPCAIKGLPIFLEMARQMPDIEFAAVPTWGTTTADIAVLEQLPNVRLLKSTEKIDEIYAQTRVLLMPSLWAEAYGRTSVEAMLRGIPVLASNVGGMPEAKLGLDYILPVKEIERYEERFDEQMNPIPIIPDQDVGPWVQALRELLSSRDRYETLSKKSQETAHNYLSYHLSIDIFEEFLENLTPAAIAPANGDLLKTKELRLQNSNILDRVRNLSPEKRSLLALRLKKKAANIPQTQTIPTRNDKNSAPLSFAQQRLWFLDQLEPGSSAYNIPFALRLTGELNAIALENSLNSIRQRHEVLRTTFAVVDGEPVQAIAPTFSVPLPVVNLSQLPASQQEDRVQKFVTEEVQRPFDLTKGPLLRATLLKLDDREHVLLLTMHHIVTDGWSMRIFFRELTEHYKAYSQGLPCELPDLPIQYADFAAWLRQWLQGDVLEEQLSYWKQQLGGRLPVLELPTDRDRSTVQTVQGSRQSLLLSSSLSSALKTLSQRSGTTLFMTLLAAFKTLLYRHTGQEDILVGFPSANRNRSQIESLIGFFINTLVLRTDLSGSPRFNEILDRVRQVALGAYAHQDMPFEKLVEELQPERDLSRTPLFQVFFNMLNYEQKNIEFQKLIVENLPIPEPASKFDLTFYVKEIDQKIQFSFVYNAELFASSRIAKMLEQFQYLLEQIVENPETKISEFSLVTPQTQEILPNPAKPMLLEWEGAVHAHFSKQAKRVPHQVALVNKQEAWNYAELESISNQLANYLRASGIQSGDIIAIYAHRSAALVWSLLGILKAGAAFIILDATYPAQRLIDCLELASIRGFLQMEAAGTLPNPLQEFVATLSLSCEILLPSEKAIAQNSLQDYSADAPNVEVNPDDLAYIAFTSGSTGKPKGILGTHRPLSHFLKWHSETFEFNKSDRFSLLSGLSHDPLLRDIFTPLWLGATVYIPEPEKIGIPGGIFEWMKRHEITVAHLTPAIAQLLSEMNSTTAKEKITSLRYAFFGGDIVTQRDVEKLRAIAPNVTCVNFYGATETPQAMGYFVTSAETLNINKIPLGRGIKDVQLLILNASQKLAGIGELGEIYIRTPYLAKGYLGDETLTSERFITNPLTLTSGDRLYKTGDLGRYLPDGNITIVGRADNQVKIRGFRIEPGEIEQVLNAHPAVKQSVAIAREDEPGDKRLVAYIVSKPERAIDVSELRNWLQERLPNYMVPSAFVLLEALPLTPNGKLDRRALPIPDFNKSDRTGIFLTPRDEIESQLTEIWKQVLKVDSPNIKDNFFELGGHSLLAVRLFSQIQEKFEKTLPLATLFQAPTVEQMAAVLRDREWSAAWESLVLIQKGDPSKKPLFCIHAIGGNILSYKPVVAYMNLDWPVYGLQARGLDGVSEPHSKIEEMAADYIQEMRRVQPAGPYYLAGHSLGGIVAFEIAQQLVEAGQKVALLALFDTFSPSVFQQKRPPFRYNFYIHWLNLKQLKSTDKAIYILERVWWKVERLIEKIKDKFYEWTGRSNPNELPEHFQRIEKLNGMAIKNYVPDVYPGKLTLLRAIERPTKRYYDPLLGWGELAAGGVEIVEVPGHHKTLILEPRVRFLAEALKDCLEKAQSFEG